MCRAQMSGKRMSRKYIFALSLASIGLTILYYVSLLNDATLDETPLKEEGTKHIVIWTKIFGNEYLSLDASCSSFNNCITTYDRNKLASADAIVYHLADIKEDDLPDEYKKKPNVINVLMTQESYPNIVNQLLKLTKCKFHWIMTFLTTSHVPYVYGGYWIKPNVAKLKGFAPESLPFRREEILVNKSRSIFWLVSNCNTSSRREDAVKAIQRHIPVDVFGSCAENQTLRNACPRTSFNCHVFELYYFGIIAENSICKEYITEKYWDRYSLPFVPIVLRRKTYETLVPHNSFIAMDDFKRPKELSDYLRFLINNPDKYMKYFEWRAEGWAKAPWNGKGYENGLCKLCNKLLESPPPSVPIADVIEWFRTESECENGQFVKDWISSSLDLV